MARLSIAIACVLLSGMPILTAPEPAPGFALPNNNGTMVFKSSLRGNLLISFFASYCRPCAKELPQLIELEKKYGERKRLSMVLISADVNDADGDAKEKAGRFLRKAGIEREYLLDIYHVVILKYNPKKALPATFLVDCAGNIVFREIGAHKDTIDRLERAIQRL
jgi:peroxiredoxin